MALPEILIDAVNGPTLTFIHSDGSSSSLSINTSNQLVALSASVAIPYAQSVTASYSQAAMTASYVAYSNLGNVPGGIISSSAQLPPGIISSSVQLPSGVVSSSAQIVAGLPSGTVSGSSQVFAGSTVWSSSAQLPSGIYSSSAQLPSGIVSSSAQTVTLIAGQQISPAGVTASLFGTSSWSANALNSVTSSYVTFTNVANKPVGLVSSSAQVLVGSTVWSSSAQLPSGVVSSSTQVLVGSGVYSSSVQLPTGLVSSSAQVVSNLVGTQISPAGVTASLFGTSSWSARSVTASYALTASYVNMEAQPAVAYSYINKTNTQAVTVANTFEGVTFNSNVRTDSTDWTYSATTNSLTCLTAGVYLIDSTFFVQKTGGTSKVGGVRLTKNGAEITGSFMSYTFASNNVIQPLAVQVLDSFVANDILAAQVIGGATTIQLAPVPSIGSAVTRPSATLRVVRG